MEWFPQDDEEEEISFSPALLARRASESWIDTSLSVEVEDYFFKCLFLYF